MGANQSVCCGKSNTDNSGYGSPEPGSVTHNSKRNKQGKKKSANLKSSMGARPAGGAESAGALRESIHSSEFNKRYQMLTSGKGTAFANCNSEGSRENERST